ncbi:hypothetical protein [Georgenia alba]|uniref:Uncharacterized protein n=1 Tax=Georgenia alba TaxID=2233858 RepID=A0ABW2QCB8_9MICO
MTRATDRAAASPVGNGHARDPRLPLVVVLAQLQLLVYISVLPVSSGPIAEDLDAAAREGGRRGGRSG